jgi:hypothetical protein
VFFTTPTTTNFMAVAEILTDCTESQDWSIPEIVDTSEKHDTAQGGVLVNSISQFLHLVKAKIEKTLWEKLYVRFGS